MLNFELVCCIVNSGHGSKALSIAKHHGIRGGTIFLGKGTVKNKMLEFLDLDDIRKEIVLMVDEKAIALDAMKKLSKEMAFHKQNHGIAFSFPISNFIGTKHCEYNDNVGSTNKEVSKPVYNAIFTVVDKGMAEEVVETATKHGARGGTIINARGSGINDTSMLFAMPIEPEKEIVLIIVKSELTKPITAAVREQLKIDEPGHGVIFILNVNETCGIY